MTTNKVAARIRSRNAAKAQARYDELTAEASRLMDSIRDEMAAHELDGPINYGHVGDIAYLVEQLTAAADFINGTNDEE